MRTRLSTLSALTVLIIAIWNSPALAQQAVEPYNQTLLYTVVGDSLVAFGWIPGEDHYEQVWSSPPLRLQYANDVNWIISDKIRTGEKVPAIIGIDRYGLIRFHSHNRYPEYLPFREVDISYGGGRKHVYAIENDDNSYYLVHRRQMGSTSRRILELYQTNNVPLRTDLRYEGAPVPSWSFSVADLNDDDIPEVLIGGRHINVFQFEDDGSLGLVKTIPFAGLVDVIRVGDVDGDNIPEIIASGSNGRVTVYRKTAINQWYFPVIWQSDNLGGFSQGLAISDLSEKPGKEIVCATFLFPKDSGYPQG